MNLRSLILHPFEVRAIIDGRLSQIRRPATFFNEPEAVKMGFGNDCAKQFNPRFEDGWWKAATHGYQCRCPLGKVGDSVIGKETWAEVASQPYADGKEDRLVIYRASASYADRAFKTCKSPATMPAWASRITLTLTEIRVERVQEIGHKDALKCGVEYDVAKPDGSPLSRFETLWNSLYAKRGLGWDANPWCWVYTVKPEVLG